jgi:hypothetical protein
LFRIYRCIALLLQFLRLCVYNIALGLFGMEFSWNARPQATPAAPQRKRPQATPTAAQQRKRSQAN